MLLHQRFVPELAINSYIVGDERTGEAAVIDPTRDVEEFLRYARENGLRIGHVVETHVHADFLSGAREIKARLEGRPTIHASGQGGPEWTPAYADRVVKDGDAIALGSLRLGVWHTPGHTPEHVCLTLVDTTRSADVPWLLFTGDFLFVGDVGRPDLLGADAQRRLAHDLYQSVFDRLPGLPDFTEIFPAHGSGSLCGKAISSRRSSTLGYERRFNPSLVRKPEEEWVRDLLAGMPLAPPYFRRMKRVNREGPPILGPDLPGRRAWTPGQVRAEGGDSLILDVRSKEAFAAAHLPGALNVPRGPSLPTWAGWVVPYDRPLLLVLDDANDLVPIVTQLIRIGFDDIRGYLEGGIEAWATAGQPLATLRTLSVHDLQRELSRAPHAVAVLDVRTDREWQAGHIDGATHVHGGRLADSLDRVPRDRPVAVICGTGYRSSIAASCLQAQGYEAVANVIGGMTAWQAAGLPTTRT